MFDMNIQVQRSPTDRSDLIIIR